MDFGDLFQLVIFLLIVLSALFGTMKKKKPPSSGRSPAQRRPPRPPARRPTQAPQPSARSRPLPTGERPDEENWLDLLREQLDIAAGRAPTPRRTEPPLPEGGSGRAVESLERVPAVEAQSLETLEPAGGERHRRFHDRYVEPLAVPGVKRHPGVRLPSLTPGTAREAMIWREVIGPPKGTV